MASCEPDREGNNDLQRLFALFTLVRVTPWQNCTFLDVEAFAFVAVAHRLIMLVAPVCYLSGVGGHTNIYIEIHVHMHVSVQKLKHAE